MCRSQSIAAHRGQLDLARAHAERALRLGGRAVRTAHSSCIWRCSVSSPTERRSADGARLVRRGMRGDGRGSAGVRRDVRWWVADQVEALLERGRPRRGRADPRGLGGGRGSLERDWVLADVTRCRGLVAAAARKCCRPWLRCSSRARSRSTRPSGIAFGRARAQLALGVVRRRDRQKRAARDAIGRGPRRLRGAWRCDLGRALRLASPARSAAAPARRASRRPNGASPRSSPRAARTARSPPHSSSASARSRDASGPRLREARCALTGRA